MKARPEVHYGAKSSTDPRGSIGTQLDDCAKAAVGEVGGKYSDENASAFHGNRDDGLVRAMAHCERLAAEHGGCVLRVQHSDRLARGDGKHAKHLVEYALWALKADVTIESVQDPQTFGDLLYAVVTGQRNHEDSARKAQATRDGMRRAAERGDWMGRGLRLDGYTALREVDSRGRVEKTWIKDPDRKHIWELIWGMALAGKSIPTIQLECSSRGFLTAPVRKDHRPRPFDINRLSQSLDRPAYAGLVVYKGEVLPTPGNWPAYVDPEDFFRLREERGGRAPATKASTGDRKTTSRENGKLGGRPPVGYLLSKLATCGVCGRRMRVETYREKRKDGTSARRYVCQSHREHHRDSAEWCPATPADAVEVDRIVLGGIDTLLRDADSLRGQLLSGRRAPGGAGAARAGSGVGA